MAQVFFYDPDWQSCFAFKYTGCGGNANRFITIDDCESKCLYGTFIHIIKHICEQHPF